MKAISLINTKFILFLFAMIFPFFNFAQEESKYKTLTPEEFYIYMNENPHAVVIDVQTDSRHKKIRIPNSIHSESKKVLRTIVDTLDVETPIMVYCQVGARSKTVSDFLVKELKWETVLNLKGGMNAWKKLDYPVDKRKIK